MMNRELMATTRAANPLREFRRYFMLRWLLYVMYGSGPFLLIGFLLIVPNHPDMLTWPGSVIWMFPALLYPMLAAGIRMDLNARRFWTALQTRIRHASYYGGEVTAVFDTNLVAEATLGLRQLGLYFDDQHHVLSPALGNIGYWEYRSQHILARASELDGENSIPGELRRIRELLGGRPPHGPLASQQLLLTEHTKPVPQWREARYSIRLSLSIPRSKLTPQTLLNGIDDITVFLTEAAVTMFRRSRVEPDSGPGGA